MTVERDLSRLRFLVVRIQKGENNITSDDIDFMIKNALYLSEIVVELNIALDVIREREKQL